MNERLLFEAMLKKAGIEYTKDRDKSDLNKTTYGIQAHDGPNNLGYRGFVTYWEFINDELKTVGTWE